MFEFALSANYLHSLHKDLDTKEAISDRSQWDRILKNVYESFFCENASQPVELSNLVSSANRGGQWGVRSTNSKLVLQNVKGQTVQGQTAQEFWLFSADPQCLFARISLYAVSCRLKRFEMLLNRPRHDQIPPPDSFWPPASSWRNLWDSLKPCRNYGVSYTTHFERLLNRPRHTRTIFSKGISRYIFTCCISKSNYPEVAIRKWRQTERERGRGVSKFLTKGRVVAWSLYYEFWHGGVGVWNPENLADVIYVRPLMSLLQL